MTLKPSVITKRDGSVVAFEARKIRDAVEKAGLETGELGTKEATQVMNHVLDAIRDENDFEKLTVDKVQDMTEFALMDLVGIGR